MKIYRTEKGIVLEKGQDLYLVKDQDWDEFINDDKLFRKITDLVQDLAPDEQAHDWLANALLPPIANQEVWASGVTYYRSKLGRQEESKDSGGGTFYEMVYQAERPELFMKATGPRVMGHMQQVRIRKDSNWNVPEPELTLLISSSGKILGYTIGNDMSSRSIEGENPLYLPQAKVYDGSTALGPCILVSEEKLPLDTAIKLEIIRDSNLVFSDFITIDQIKRKFIQLVEFLYREYTFPAGAFLMTGTGIVPDHTFTLQSGDKIKIHIDGIGTLINSVA
ncbi:fumarylacetoacetate hydrolase family protein [Cyclobacterium jeungdonense]|uniref:Fumarylacetoacetate hydrolase family protein n=1 Tax=Cyclobacterium jeungdonense TaxID=708087 RepID=A0ABT8CB27_9BACT|nr:fumarylacetoacetate hydrolase family protein [Cyclobacterium jeungdonense]MDN3689994.1 fumarylacetoacetate hydrolase family protein [Cyclobacterium jeungdonense]